MVPTSMNIQQDETQKPQISMKTCFRAIGSRTRIEPEL